MLNHPPYKDDVTGEYRNRLSQWQEQYFLTLHEIRSEFISSVVRGEADLDTEWETYLANLNANGYREYLDYLEPLPVTGE